MNEHADAEQTERAVEAEGRACILLLGDVSNSEFCTEAVDKTLTEFGQLDVLVNTAAFQEHVDKFEDLSDEHFDQTIKTNLYGYFYMAKAAVRHESVTVKALDRERVRHREVSAKTAIH